MQHAFFVNSIRNCISSLRFLYTLKRDDIKSLRTDEIQHGYALLMIYQACGLDKKDAAFY